VIPDEQSSVHLNMNMNMRREKMDKKAISFPVNERSSLKYISAPDNFVNLMGEDKGKDGNKISRRKGNSKVSHKTYSPIINDEHMKKYFSKPLYSKPNNNMKRENNSYAAPRLNRSSKVLQSTAMNENDKKHTSDLAYLDDAYCHE